MASAPPSLYQTHLSGSYLHSSCASLHGVGPPEPHPQAWNPPSLLLVLPGSWEVWLETTEAEARTSGRVGGLGGRASIQGKKPVDAAASGGAMTSFPTGKTGTLPSCPLSTPRRVLRLPGGEVPKVPLEALCHKAEKHCPRAFRSLGQEGMDCRAYSLCARRRGRVLGLAPAHVVSEKADSLLCFYGPPSLRLLLAGSRNTMAGGASPDWRIAGIIRKQQQEGGGHGRTGPLLFLFHHTAVSPE